MIFIPYIDTHFHPRRVWKIRNLNCFADIIKDARKTFKVNFDISTRKNIRVLLLHIDTLVTFKDFK